MSFIRCSNIESVNVHNGSDVPIVNDTEVNILMIPIPLTAHLKSQYKSLLTITELEKAAKYRKLDDSDRFMAGRGTLKMYLGQCVNTAPQKIEVLVGVNQKPYIAPIRGTQFHFNIAHAGAWVVIAVSLYEVGIDIEYLANDLEISELANETFSDEERAFLNLSSTPTDDFFRIWTRKEAILKATGKGIDEDLALIPSLNGLHKTPMCLSEQPADWNVGTFLPDPKHICSIAHHPAVHNVSAFTLAAG